MKERKREHVNVKGNNKNVGIETEQEVRHEISKKNIGINERTTEKENIRIYILRGIYLQLFIQHLPFDIFF